MTAEETVRERLVRRAATANLTLSPALVDDLESYLQLLTRWNRRMNLTALPLEPLTDQAIDRLLVEPLAAARFVPEGSVRWYDLGSGGGSPAIPLKLVRPNARLTMVESKGRKAAFLREAVRALDLEGVAVDNRRFEALAADEGVRPVADFITVRAVRVDEELGRVATALLSPDGRVLFFTSSTAGAAAPPGFHVIAAEMVALSDPTAQLVLMQPLR